MPIDWEPEPQPEPDPEPEIPYGEVEWSNEGSSIWPWSK
jgi:hypothetical protein